MLKVEKHTLRELTADEVSMVAGGTEDPTTQASGQPCWDLITQSSIPCAATTFMTSYYCTTTATTTSNWCESGTWGS